MIELVHALGQWLMGGQCSHNKRLADVGGQAANDGSQWFFDGWYRLLRPHKMLNNESC